MKQDMSIKDTESLKDNFKNYVIYMRMIMIFLICM